MSSVKLRKTSFVWHRKLAWFGLLGLVLFIISALTHPILSWTGPKAAKFRPPSAQIKPESLHHIPSILKRHNIEWALVIKIIPSDIGNVLQVTEKKAQSRRYFDLGSGDELMEFDRRHAVWLANYYLGNQSPAQVKSVEFKTQFNSAYPWVNRLLPVYRVQFEDDANTSTYIYTELNVLAGMGNDYKTIMQSIFRNLHTWSWLNNVEYARILIMALLLICVMLLTLAGIGLLVLMRGRKNSTLTSKAHRYIAYIVALPLLCFCISGFYHLLHYGLVDTHRGMVTGDPIDLRGLSNHVKLNEFPTSELNHASLISHQGNLYYRLSLPHKAAANPDTSSNEEHAHHAARVARYKGQPTEAGGLYYSAITGLKANVSDREIAMELASKHLHEPLDKISESKLITRFGMHYDFRNKRLPVWQVDFDNSVGDKLFIDPATGTVVDRLVDQDRYESYAFSFLHKWNFLTPFVGRFWRDVLVVIILGFSLLISCLGLAMKLRKGI